MENRISNLEANGNFASPPVENGGGIKAKPTLDGFFQPDSFQNVPSLLLIDLSRKNANGESVLELQDIAVYAMLKSHSRLKGNCYPSLTRLAMLAAVSVSTIQRSLKRLADAGHIQRKSHNKGKIFILTDVAANSKIVHRQKMAFAPPKREICPPEFQDVMRDASTEDNFFGAKSSAENGSEENPPTMEENPPMIDGESLF